MVGWLTGLEQSFRLPITLDRNPSVLLTLGSVKPPPTGGLSFLASVTASQMILMIAATVLALRRDALADALRSLNRRQ